MQPYAKSQTPKINFDSLSYESEGGVFSIKLEELGKHIIKVTARGNVSVDDYHKSMELINHLMDKKKEYDGVKTPYFFLANTKDLKKITFKARNLITQTMSQFYSENNFLHTAFVSPNYVVRTLGTVTAKLSKNTTYSSHSSEEKALKRLLSEFRKLQEGSDLLENLNIDLITPFGDDWRNASSINIHGKDYDIISLPEWGTATPEDPYYKETFLIANKIAFFKSYGYMGAEEAINFGRIYKRMLDYSGNDQLYYIFDLTDVRGMSLRARKEMSKIYEHFYDTGIHIFYIFSGFLRTMYQIYNSLYPRYNKNLTIARNWEEALSLCVLKSSELRKGPGLQELNPVYTLPVRVDDMSGYTKEELQGLVKDLSDEIQSLKAHQEKRTEEIFKVMSRITWDEQFEPEYMEDIPETDDFYGVAQALTMLQHDVQEMVTEVRLLNTELEKKVADRTQALDEKQANLRAVIENTPDCIFSIDKSFRVLVANSAYKKHLRERYGATIEIGDFIFKEGLDHRKNVWGPIYKKVLSGKGIHTLVTRKFDGGIFHYNTHGSPVLDGNNEVCGATFYVRDITESKKTNDLIKENEQLLASINYNIKEGIYRSTPEDGLLYVNKAFVEMFGYESVDEVLSLESPILYASPERRQELVKIIMEGKQFYNQEIEFVKKDGSTFWGLASSFMSEDENGRIIFDGAIRDVTQAKETERMLKSQNEELKKVNSELDRFVYSTSHDLRAPLVSLAGLINVAKIADSDIEREKYFSLMDTSIRKMDEFIQDIINYSRNSRQDLRKDEIVFSDLIQEILRNFIYTEHNNHTIHTILEINQKLQFRTDKRRLQTILNNLISNAHRYSDPEKTNSFVKIKINTDAERAVIEISDNGIGIPEEHQQRVFEMFYRASQKSQGSGLGLYIVSETLQKMGGTISFSSKEGYGTSFKVTIPLLPEGECGNS